MLIFQFLIKVALVTLIVTLLAFGVFEFLFSDECESEMGYLDDGVCQYE